LIIQHRIGEQNQHENDHDCLAAQVNAPYNGYDAGSYDRNNVVHRDTGDGVDNEGDTINLDALFDNLGTGNAATRAGEVDVSTVSGTTTVTVINGGDTVNVILDGVDLGLADGDGIHSAAQLALKGIIVDES